VRLQTSKTSMNITVFWKVSARSPLQMNRSFTGTYMAYSSPTIIILNMAVFRDVVACRASVLMVEEVSTPERRLISATLYVFRNIPKAGIFKSNLFNTYHCCVLAGRY
jgi:hypothetical protein